MEDRGVPDMPGELVSEELGMFLRSTVSQILHTRPREFPGSQPVSFTRDHLTGNLMHKDYLVCEKSDGLRCLMFTIKHPDSKEDGTFLINRANDYYFVDGFHFPRTKKDNFESTHNGTILDGELVFSINKTTGIKEIRYLIFDCLGYDMKSVMNKSLYKRLYHAQHDFHAPYLDMRRRFPERCLDFPFKLDFKNMTQPFKIRKIFKEMPNLTYVSDGLILTCCETPYTPGTDSTLLKWKPAEENTIDFKLKLEFPKYIDKTLPKHDPSREYFDYDSKPRIKLLIWKGGEDLDVATNKKMNGGKFKADFSKYDEFNELSLTDEEWEELKSRNEKLNGRIAEVRFDQEDQKWKFLRFRDDKASGNYQGVVLKVLKSIEDSVKKEELIEAEDEIKRNWEERERMRKLNIKPPGNSQNQHVPPPQPHQQPHQSSKSVNDTPHEVIRTDANTHKRKEETNFDDDSEYESDGFEMPTYTDDKNGDGGDSPKYGDLERVNKKRKY